MQIIPVLTHVTQGRKKREDTEQLYHHSRIFHAACLPRSANSSAAWSLYLRKWRLKSISQHVS
ncbi:hypothetical protein E2C01_065532 [Portunus trituberculatus]|uniref:Uncharacterized protein n=1 Tax=Portunus trituberculatus TaxID=210409 RepID=A0A5B7HEU8_PORTR|nr:hypothetical protein [Portunus trituberculatus]